MNQIILSCGPFVQASVRSTIRSSYGIIGEEEAEDDDEEEKTMSGKIVYRC